MSELVKFLRVRVSEDAAWARAQSADAMVGWRWKGYPEDAYNEIQSRVLRQVARVLAECEAKQRIVEDATNQHTSCVELDDVVRILAAVYATHPDYREEWRP